MRVRMCLKMRVGVGVGCRMVWSEGGGCWGVIHARSEYREADTSCRAANEKPTAEESGSRRHEFDSHNS